MCFGALREGMRSEVRRVLSGLLWRLEGFAGGQGQGEARQLATRAAAPGLWREVLPPAESVRKDPTRLPVGLDLGRACPFPRPSARAEAAAPAARSLPFCSSPGQPLPLFLGLPPRPPLRASSAGCASGIAPLARRAFSASRAFTTAAFT